MRTKHLVSLKDLSLEDFEEVFGLTENLKKNPEAFSDALKGKTLAMIFEKPSTRTRVSFEAGMTRLGGHAMNLSPKEMQLGRGETIEDTARVLSRFVDAIMARVYSHNDIERLAMAASVPVINGLSDFSHPCQGLTDLFTIKEKKGAVKGVKIAYVGDANNNVCHSLLFGASTLGASMSIACPSGYEPDPQVLAWAREHANGSKFEVTRDPFEATKDADVVYTDVFVSMGQEAQKEKRLRDLKDYQVNLKVFENAKKDAVFMHCLPAHRGEEVTDDVIDHKRSIVLDQAENRMHCQMALLLLLIKGKNL